jgi:O-antigen/teichoic acid export membrane protein
VLVVSAAAAAVVVLLASSIAEVLVGESHAQGHDMVWALYVLASFLPLAAAYAVIVSTSRGLGSIKPLVLIEKIGRHAVQTAFVGVVLLITPSLLLAVVAWAAPYAAAAAVMVLTVLRLVRLAMADAERPLQPRPMRTLAAEFWSFSAPRALSRIFSVALQRFDVLLVSAIRGLEEAAVYAAASRFVLLGLMFVQAIQQVMAPRISEFLARGDRPRAHVIYETTTAWLMLISWPIYLTAAIFAPFLLGVFGAGYSTGATVVVILCLSMLVATACGPVDTVLLMAGRSRWSLFNTGLALAVNVGVDLLLVPTYGINGAAVGWAAGIAMNNLVPLYQVHRFLGMHPFGVASIRAAAIAMACFGGWGLLGRFALGATVSGCVSAATLAVLSYLVCMWWQRDALEVDALVSVVRRRRRS